MVKILSGGSGAKQMLTNLLLGSGTVLRPKQMLPVCVHKQMLPICVPKQMLTICVPKQMLRWICPDLTSIRDEAQKRKQPNEDNHCYV